MATNSTKQPFYGEVDRYRFRTNWGCLGWVLVITIIIASSIIWWWLKHA